MIVVWGIQKNMCNSERGFRREFLNNERKEAIEYIREQCIKIPTRYLNEYAMYITDETVGLEEVIYYHSLIFIATGYKGTNNRIEVVDVPRLKAQVDENYGGHLEDRVRGQDRIDRQVKQLSNLELRELEELNRKYVKFRSDIWNLQMLENYKLKDYLINC